MPADTVATHLLSMKRSGKSHNRQGAGRAAGGVWLDVPFRSKDDAKAHGARWDPEARLWFDPAGRSAYLNRKYEMNWKKRERRQAEEKLDRALNAIANEGRSDTY